jgi:hypothetical protein
MAWIRDVFAGGALETLTRYETTIFRGLTRALHELQALQDRGRRPGK